MVEQVDQEYVSVPELSSEGEPLHLQTYVHTYTHVHTHT